MYKKLNADDPPVTYYSVEDITNDFEAFKAINKKITYYLKINF